MKVLNITAMSLALLPSLAQAQDQSPEFPYKLKKIYETQGFENPESIVVDHANKALYVSNVNGNPTAKVGNGYISKVGLDGNIITKKWITGLNAPKGIAIHDSKLYIADIDTLVVADITTGKIVSRYTAKGSTFLNDVSADPTTGDVYISNTFGKSSIYQFHKGKLSLLLEDPKLSMPNGLSFENGQLLIANWGEKLNPETYSTETPGKVLSLNTKTKKLTNITANLGNLDGLTPSAHGHFISDWIAGKVYYRSSDTGKVTEALKLTKGSADLVFDNPTKTLIVPLMLDNKIQGYKISK